MTKSTQFKISKKRLMNAREYLDFVNRNKLENLDLSEFFEGDLTKAINAFHFIGLNNVDFLTSDFVFRQRRKYKIKIL